MLTYALTETRTSRTAEILKELSRFQSPTSLSCDDFKEATELLKELRGALDTDSGLLIREIMGKNFIGPEAYKDLLGVTSLGAAPELPAEITPELLESPCPFETKKWNVFGQKRKIKDTHLLLFLPNQIDGEAFTIKSLRSRVAGSKEKHKRGAVFYDTNWLNDQEFADTPLSQGEWVLVPMVDLPDSKRKNNAEQLAELEEFPEYRTAKALEIVTALVMSELTNHERRFSDFCGACEELTDDGADISSRRRVCVGRLYGSGLNVARWNDVRDSHVGRAVVRRFGN